MESKALQAGFYDVAAPVQSAAGTLLEDYPAPLALLTGISLAEQQVLLDLVAITASAAVVVIDAAREGSAEAGPQEAGRAVADLQRRAGMEPPLPVYVCWFGAAPPGGRGTPALADAAQLQRYIQEASSLQPEAPERAGTRLADLLLQADTARTGDPTPTPPLQRALRALGQRLDVDLLDNVSPIRSSRRNRPLRPADINRHLRNAMFDPNHLLEDVNYGKVVPNEFLVEIGAGNFERHYEPIAGQVTEQWEQRLLEALNTANSRRGRRDFRFGGPVTVSVRGTEELEDGEVRIRCRIQADEALSSVVGGRTVPCLEWMASGRRWRLNAPLLTLGRSRQNDIALEDEIIQEKRLVSSQHAHIRCESGRCRLFDGSPDGKPSLNGTFVNARRVGEGGRELRDGDVIILAAHDPADPRPDTPGAASFVFHAVCES